MFQANRADATPDHDAEKHEQEPVHRRAPHDHLQGRDAQAEEL
jgi:hypothetical protein